MSVAARKCGWLLLAGGLACACSGGSSGEGEGAAPLPRFPADVALPVPQPSDGFQIHFGPDDLDDPESVAPFLLEPGHEEVVCGYARAPNEADAFYSAYEIAQREGAHHLVVSGSLPDAPHGNVFDCAFEEATEFFLNVQGALVPGGNRFTHPDPGAVAPENMGLAYRMPARQGLTMQGHYVNSKDAPLLEEIWLNFHFLPEEEVKTLAGPFTFYVGTAMSIPPHTRQTVKGTCAPPAGATELRLLDLFGHVHSHGKRVSAWHVSPDPAGGEPLRQLVYETYEWQELERYAFDSLTRNPPVSYGSGRGGASTGILHVGAQDWLELECEFDNTGDEVLTYSAQAFAGEMCAGIGAYAPGTGERWRCSTD